MAYYSGLFGSSGMCPHWRGVPISRGWIRGVPCTVHVLAFVYTTIDMVTVLHEMVGLWRCQITSLSAFDLLPLILAHTLQNSLSLMHTVEPLYNGHFDN